MADCSNNFKDAANSFYTKISLTQSEIQGLIRSRNALRTKIRSFLTEKKVASTKFYMQGSYAHKTLIKPLDLDYDIDDGVYIDLSNFEELPSTATIHNWIAKAVEDHTQIKPVNKECCVRSIFKAGYHVDLPAYRIDKDDSNETYYLAKRTSGWEESDPRGMTRWLEGKIKENSSQLRRIVKYIKAWKDNRNTKSSTKLPNGLTLTILAGEEFISDIREDLCFLETVRAILKRLEKDDAIWKPYEPTENMRNYLSDPQFDNFLKELEFLVTKGDEAIGEIDAVKAATSWQKTLGDRFPIIDDTSGGSKKADSFKKAAVVGTTVKSA